MGPLSAAPRAFTIFKRSWGSAALHPRLYAVVRFADFQLAQLLKKILLCFLFLWLLKESAC